MKIFTAGDNLSLDNIIAARRTVRQFKEEMPPKSCIEAIIETGKKAPYAAISAPDVDVFRHFFVIPRESELLPEIDRLIKEQSNSDLGELEKEMSADSFINDHSKILHNVWSMVSKKGIPGFMKSPYLIVTAEWAGARRAQRQSLAHVMQNMWLKAAALNLGFVLVSPIESMMDNKEFCSLFNLPAGRYGFHGCVVGYPQTDPNKLTANPANSRVSWL